MLRRHEGIGCGDVEIGHVGGNRHGEGQKEQREPEIVALPPPQRPQPEQRQQQEGREPLAQQQVAVGPDLGGEFCQGLGIVEIILVAGHRAQEVGQGLGIAPIHQRIAPGGQGQVEVGQQPGEQRS